jgi:microcystin-dependent protein
MSDPFVGEIRMFAGTFAPRSWALCDGQLLSVSQNDALFSLLGTIYGGDGRTTFGLPDLRGRIPIHAGSGPGLTPRTLGAKSGGENATVSVNELPTHTHPFKGTNQFADTSNPSGNTVAKSTTVDAYINENPSVNLSGNAVTSEGGSQNHTNLMPFLCINFIIALFGIYPSRN